MIAVGLLLAGIALAPAARAQTAADINRATQQQQQIQRSEQERLQQELERDRNSSRPPADLEAPLPPPLTTSPTGPCLNIKTIKIDGAEHLDDDDRASLTAPSQGKCLTKAAIETLMADITANYIARGYSTTRVYLPAQDLQSGVLKIRVVEGRVETVVIDDPGYGRMGAMTAFPGVVGEPFNLRDFEQGLDQLNKLLYNNATIDIQPGKEAGDSVVVIHNTPTKLLPMGVNVSRDNEGMTSTGRVQDNASLDLDGLLGLNELLTLTDLHSHAYAGTGHDSHATSAALSVPFGYTTVTGNVSQSQFSTLVQGTSLAFLSTGTTLTEGLVVDHLVYRDKDSKVTLSTGLTRKDTQSWIAGNLVDVSSHVLTVWDGDVRATTSFLGGNVNADLGYSQGLHLMGAKADENPTATDPRAEFKKIRTTAGWDRPFDVLDQKFDFNTQVTGQYGIDVLYGSEQISAGGLSSVRGYLDTMLAGDRGWYVHNDLVLNESWKVEGLPIEVKPKFGYDYGDIVTRNGNPGGVLSGIGYGATTTVGPFTLDLLRVMAVIHSDALNREPPYTFLKLSFGL